MKGTIEMTISLRVDEADLISAVESGCISGPHGYMYWCSNVDLPLSHTDDDVETMVRRLLDGGVTHLEVLEEEGLVQHALTRDKLLAGFGRWAVEQGNRTSTENGVTSFEIDAPASDMIMQFALFGEQKYG